MRLGASAALLLALTAFAGCSDDDGLRLILVESGDTGSTQFKVGPTTYHCGDPCHRIKVKVINDTPKFVKLDASRWRTVWPSGHPGSVYTVDGGHEIAPGGAFDVVLQFGTPSGAKGRAAEVWLFNTTATSESAVVLARLRI